MGLERQTYIIVAVKRENTGVVARYTEIFVVSFFKNYLFGIRAATQSRRVNRIVGSRAARADYGYVFALAYLGLYVFKNDVGTKVTYSLPCASV